MARVELSDVRKVYEGGVVAVERFSLDIADGEFIVLVGPSGCGKSTTLRMVAGLESISGGTVTIGDRVVNDVHPKDRDIAMVFQNYALYPHMSVRRNMAFGLMLRKMPRDEIARRVDQVAEMLGLSALLDRKPKALSGGQRQRVALGRAIVREPEVFLFDEPLSNLDAKLRVGTRTELKSLHNRLRTTTIYVTHDQEEAMTLGDRIVVMSEGRVQQVDTPLGIFNRPSNRFVASFLGSPPMNFVDGSVEKDGEAMWFRSREPDALRVRLPGVDGQVLDSRSGEHVVLGFRPAALSERAEGKFALPAGFEAGSGSIAVRTRVIEPLGEQVDVSCALPGGQEIMARLDAREGFGVDQQIDLHVDLDHVHVFEPGEFGANLLRPSRTPALAGA